MSCLCANLISSNSFHFQARWLTAITIRTTTYMHAAATDLVLATINHHRNKNQNNYFSYLIRMVYFDGKLYAK